MMGFTNLKKCRVFLVLLLFLVGCASVKERKFEKDGLTLMYQSTALIDLDGNEVKLKHPVSISETMVRKQLASIYFEDMTLLGKEKPVFTVDDIGKIAPWLTKALNRVTINNIVYFEIQGAKGYTAVEVFASAHNIHWRFITIRGLDYKKANLASWANSWRLVPKKGQAYYRVDKILGKKTWDNWLVADLGIPEAVVKPEQSTDSKIPGKPNAGLVEEPTSKDSKPIEKKAPAKNLELEDKLRFLKQLQEKGLIDDEEYKRKRKILMDEYM